MSDIPSGTYPRFNFPPGPPRRVCRKGEADKPKHRCIGPVNCRIDPNRLIMRYIDPMCDHPEWSDEYQEAEKKFFTAFPEYAPRKPNNTRVVVKKVKKEVVEKVKEKEVKKEIQEDGEQQNAGEKEVKIEVEDEDARNEASSSNGGIQQRNGKRRNGEQDNNAPPKKK